MSVIYLNTPGTWCVLRCARCAQLRGPPPSEQSHDQRPPPPASSASIATRPGPATGSPGAGVGFLTNGPLYSRQSPHLHTRTFNYKGHHYKPRIIQKSQLPPGDTRHVSRMLTRPCPCPHYHPVCWKLSYLKFITSNPKFSNWPLNIFANNQ